MKGDRLIALFLLAALAFSPPFLTIVVDGPAHLGVPALVLYLFAAWAVLIGLLALAGRDRPHDDR